MHFHNYYQRIIAHTSILLAFYWFKLLQRELKGHVGNVYSCKFFPSGIVVLSAGADMQMKIWSAETGKEAACLIGHTAGEHGEKLTWQLLYL